ncbi:MAG: DUF4139 domain-containing protein [Myxococcota bacterium]
METVSTAVRRVTVYRNGALVVRAGTATGSRVSVGGLPLLFSSDSLRVRAEQGTVLDLEETCVLEGGGAAESPLTSEILHCSLTDESILQQDASLQTLIRGLESLRPAEAKDLPSGPLPDAASWVSLHRSATERIRELEKMRNALGVRRAENLARLKMLQARGGKDGTPPRFYRGLTFTLAGVTGPCHFELEYFVEAARWVPTYSVHLGNGEAELTLRALVAQASGEDWHDVTLHLATTDLTRETTLPEVSSWRMGRAQAAPRPAFRALPADLPMLFSGYDAAARKAPEVAPSSPPARVMAPRKDKDRARTEELRRVPAPEAPEEGGAAAADEYEMSLSEQITKEVDQPPVEVMASRTGMARALADTLPPPAAPLAKPARMAVGGAPGGGGRPAAPPAPRPPVELPPRLRYAYLRLVGPEEPGRGTLRPVDVFTQLWSLVEGHALADAAVLRRALDALRAAAERLHATPLPSGTTPLTGCHFHHVYAASGRHHVPSDGVFHGVTVLKDRAPAEVDYRAVPRASQEVYRFCQIRTPTGTPYAAGPLQVYVDGQYRVTAQLQATGGAGPLELNLGVDPDVRITGRTVHVHQEEKGVVSQVSRVDHKVRVQLLSTQEKPVRVVLLDRLPQPADNEKDIQVSLISSTPEAARVDRSVDDRPLRGGLRWSLTLEPNKPAAVDYHYQVTLPAKAELDGGNRRE